MEPKRKFRWLAASARVESGASRRAVLRLVLLLCLLAGLVWTNLDRLGAAVKSATQSQETLRSHWLDEEQQRYAQSLSGVAADVMVVPFFAARRETWHRQRPVAAQLLASALARRGGLRVAPPTLVAQALGAHSLDFNLMQALALADRTGTRQVVTGQLFPVADAAAFGVEIDVHERGADGWRVARRHRIERIEYNDAHPVLLALRDKLPEILPALGWPLPEAAPSAAETAATSPPTGPRELVAGDAASAVDRAIHLQLFASLHNRHDPASDDLWGRSLAAIEDAPAAPLPAVIRARALFHLGQRQAALRLLAEAQGVEADALRALLDGNLPQLETVLDRTAAPLLGLIGRIEAEDLRRSYGLTNGFQQRRQTTLERFPGFVPVAWLRLSWGDWFNEELHDGIAETLATAGVQLPAAGDFRKPAAFRLIESLIAGRADTEPLPLRIAAARDELWRSRGSGWARLPAHDRLAEWDYFELLFAIDRSTALKSVYSIRALQKLEQRALDRIAELAPAFAGLPELEAEKALTLRSMIADAGRVDEHPLGPQMRQLARSIFAWTGGHGSAASRVKHLLDPKEISFYESEVPGKTRATRIESDYRHLASTHSDYSLLVRLEKNLREAGRGDEAERMLADNAHRFIGSPTRTRHLADALVARGEITAAIDFYAENNARFPEDWAAFFNQATLLMRQGRYDEAQRVLRGFPGFADANAHPVALSNHANDAAMLLFVAGEPTLARPLFVLSQSYDTGSGAEMHSREMLARLDGRWDGAIDQARQALERYHDASAGARYLSYLFLTGRDNEAWERFRQLEGPLAGPQLWSAAFVGHRQQGANGETIRAWIVASRQFDNRRTYLSNALRERYALLSVVHDRKLDANAVALVQSVAAEFNHSPYYPSIARGLLALKEGDAAKATRELARPTRDLLNLSVSRQEAVNDLLPYMVVAQVKSGNAAAADQWLDEQRSRAGEDFYYLLARAMRQGLGGDRKGAVAALRTAFATRPSMNERNFFPAYQLLELCEQLHSESGDDEYRALLVDFARRQQLVFPYAWAYAFEALHTTSAEDRQRALAMTLRLDPQSERIRAIGTAEKDAARAWLATNPPFVVAAR